MKYYIFKKGKINAISELSSSAMKTHLISVNSVDGRKVYFNNDNIERIIEKKKQCYPANIGLIFTGYNFNSRVKVRKSGFVIINLIKKVDLTYHNGEFPNKLSDKLHQIVGKTRVLVKNSPVISITTIYLDEKSCIFILKLPQNLNGKYKIACFYRKNNQSNK